MDGVKPADFFLADAVPQAPKTKPATSPASPPPKGSPSSFSFSEMLKKSAPTKPAASGSLPATPVIEGVPRQANVPPVATLLATQSPVFVVPNAELPAQVVEEIDIAPVNEAESDRDFASTAEIVFQTPESAAPPPALFAVVIEDPAPEVVAPPLPEGEIGSVTEAVPVGVAEQPSESEVLDIAPSHAEPAGLPIAEISVTTESTADIGESGLPVENIAPQARPTPNAARNGEPVSPPGAENSPATPPVPVEFLPPDAGQTQTIAPAQVFDKVKNVPAAGLSLEHIPQVQAEAPVSEGDPETGGTPADSPVVPGAHPLQKSSENPIPLENTNTGSRPSAIRSIGQPHPPGDGTSALILEVEKPATEAAAKLAETLTSETETPEGKSAAVSTSPEPPQGNRAARNSGVSVSAPEIAGGEKPQPAAVEALVNRIGTSILEAHSGGKVMRMRMHPPELGVLQIEVASQDGIVTARLDVENTRAHRAILDSLPQLQEMLHRTHAQVDRIELHILDQHAGAEGTSAHSKGHSSGGRSAEHPFSPDGPAGNVSSDSQAEADSLEEFRQTQDRHSRSIPLSGIDIQV